MNIEKMREEFEAWAGLKFDVDAALLAKSRTEENMDDGFPYRIRNQHGEESDFVNTLVGATWAGWQASRESLVIELPDDGIEDCRKEWPERGEKYGYDTFDTGYLYACKKHEEAIESLGLKVKS